MSLTNNEEEGGQERPDEVTTPFDPGYISPEELDELLEESKKSQSSENNIDEDRQKISDDEFKNFKKNTEDRFSDIETLTKAILYVGIISLIGVIVAVMAIVIEQMHFNNATYSQEKTNSRQQVDLLKEEIRSLKVNAKK